ncbi:hypothetical protein [Bremerella cremea]|uniref:hypothetical protein n=1 Tax=Bremerella cremea TaxID=1031537 RepID=UPI0031F19777
MNGFQSFRGSVLVQSYPQSGLKQRRSGIQVLEVLLLFPVLLIATLSFFVLGPTVTIRQAVQHAAEEAAREVAKKTGTQTTDFIATDVVNESLSVHGLVLGANTGVLVVVEEDNLVTTVGDTSLATAPAAVPFANPDQVIVTVYVSVDDAPIPNELSNMGFDISGRQISHRTTAFRDS